VVYKGSFICRCFDYVDVLSRHQDCSILKVMHTYKGNLWKCLVRGEIGKNLVSEFISSISVSVNHPSVFKSGGEGVIVCNKMHEEYPVLSHQCVKGKNTILNKKRV
jgi:hypothetical protein